MRITGIVMEKINKEDYNKKPGNITESIFRSWKSKIFDEEILCSPQVYDEKELFRIKNSGHTGIWVAGLLREISHSDVFPEFNKIENKKRIESLNVLVERARKFNLGVFVYLVEPRNLDVSDAFWTKYPEIKGTRGNAAVKEYNEGYAMCTSDSRVLDFLTNSTANLFNSVPDLRGLILVTASEHQHHCLSFATPAWPEIYKKQYIGLCPRCRDRDARGIVSEIINAIAKGAFSVKENAEIIASVWGWTWYEPVPHSKLISLIDRKIAIESFFEKGGIKSETIGKEKRQMRINEYALCYTGPSEYNRKLFGYLKKKKRKFYIKMVLGTTHELITVPCIPVPDNVYEKVLRARKLQPYGFMSFTFGTIPCINLRVFEKIITAKTLPENKKKFLKKLAEEYFPGCNPELVCKAWKIFSYALKHYPFSNHLMYYGPISFALAYKQYPGKVMGNPMKPTWIPSLIHGDDLDSVCIDYDAKTIIDRFEKMSKIWKKGLIFYRNGLKNVKNNHCIEELATAEIIPLIFLSVANIFRIHLLKKNWCSRSMVPFKEIMNQELSLCLKALIFVRQNKLLGYHIEAGEYLFSEILIKNKISHIKRFLNKNFEY